MLIERDEIYMLLAYVIVLKDWKIDYTQSTRSNNIGAILVDGDGNIVFWARNANRIPNDSTQHAEARLIRNYLAKSKKSTLKNHVIYVTLEPCSICATMIVTTHIKRVVYGQTDPFCGQGLYHLAIDSQELPPDCQSYRISVKSEPSKSIIRKRLDKGFKMYLAADGCRITKWLHSPEAMEIYEEALDMFMNYQVKYPENKTFLEKALSFYDMIPGESVPLVE